MSDPIVGFKDLDEMFAWLNQAEQRANAAVVPEQRAVTWGTPWVRFYAPARLIIFGWVQSLAELEAEERRLGADDAELAQIIDHTKSMHERGFLFGRCYSTTEPEGEYGNTHRAEVWPIPVQVFLAAQGAGWDVSKMPLADRMVLRGAYQGYARSRHA